jgi:hypothetical protein
MSSKAAITAMKGTEGARGAFNRRSDTVDQQQLIYLRLGPRSCGRSGKVLKNP